MPPYLSVIIPTYNGEKFVAATLESVREQYDRELEVIVVDDGSSDCTLDIVLDLAKTMPIRLLTPGRIGNWTAISNLGLREANTEWACFLHQDDLWLPGRITRLRTEIKRAEGALILHNARFVGPEGQNLGRWTCPLAEGIVPSNHFVEHLLIQNFIAMPSPIFRRTAAIESGGLDETLWFSADWDLWLRLGALGPVRFINETLAAFRVHPASQTAVRDTKPNEWNQQLTSVLARHLQNWAAPKEYKQRVERAAMVSIAINSALSAASRGHTFPLWRLLLKLLALGPTGWYRYFRDSRITQRVNSRLKVQQLAEARKTPQAFAAYR